MTRSTVTAAARTAITGWHRGQADLTDDQLAATVFTAMPAQPDLVVFGNTVGPGGNIARIASLAAGWQTTGAVTLDAQCGSSLVAIGQDADHVKLTGQIVIADGSISHSTAWPDGMMRYKMVVIGIGAALVKQTVQSVVAVGTESPSTACPDVQRTQAAFTPAGHPDPDMTTAADQLAQNFGLSRVVQEAYAVQSHDRAMAHPSQSLIGEHYDDGPRDIRKLTGRLAAVTDHPAATVTGLTAARVADAAAAVTIAPDTTQQHLGIEVVDYRLVGADPALPGLAAAPAIEILLAAHELDVSYIQIIEIVEEYASHVLAVR